ncbi:hypothetical protein IW261DRAFT_969532 [Armillaria novae-zelandiae]|uniref:Uncharacterized protein n=1 Tax=Armillaria novae-zelandiae TaxID=153914 RepID=A0AA39PH38_9AGAR|nr:hypothetical protein IW261DRAFT_969532 [Armillaria novae-zelandiae]
MAFMIRRGLLQAHLCQCFINSATFFYSHVAFFSFFWNTMAPLLSYELSSEDSAFSRSVELETDSYGQDVVPSPEQEDLLHHLIEPFVDAVIQLRTLDNCVERRRQSQKLALSMGIDVENNTEDNLPELEQINVIEKVANDNLAMDIALLGALHEPSVLEKMSEHTDKLHHWVQTNGSHVGHVVDALMKHYKSLKFPPNSTLTDIEKLLFEVLSAITNSKRFVVFVLLCFSDS